MREILQMDLTRYQIRVYSPWQRETKDLIWCMERFWKKGFASQHRHCGIHSNIKQNTSKHGSFAFYVNETCIYISRNMSPGNEWELCDKSFQLWYTKYYSLCVIRLPCCLHYSESECCHRWSSQDMMYEIITLKLIKIDR